MKSTSVSCGCRRCLADFEPDLHRKAVMHKCRAKPLEPLEGELNTQHFMGLTRSISLELGNIHREIMEIKELEDRNSPKVRSHPSGGWWLDMDTPAVCASVGRNIHYTSLCLGAQNRLPIAVP